MARLWLGQGEPDPNKTKTCPLCGGDKTITETVKSAYGPESKRYHPDYERTVTCPTCNGSGQVPA